MNRKKRHCHMRPIIPDKYGNEWAIDVYGGNGRYQSSGFAKTKDEAIRHIKRVRRFIKKY